LSLGVSSPIGGWSAVRCGAGGVFTAALVVFTLGSIGCGFAQSLPVLVLARIVQGMGGAMMVPVGRLVLLKTVPKSELVRAMSYVSVPALVGPVIGPPLGGFIVTYGSWRWIFFINVPIGLLGILLVRLFVGNMRDAAARPFDWRGFALTGIGLASLAFGFETVGRGALPLPAALALLAGGALCIGLFLRPARHTDQPVIDLALMRIRPSAATTVGRLLFRLGARPPPFPTPLVAQIGLVLDPLRDPDVRILRQVHEEPAGDGDLRGKPRALAASITC